MTSAQATTLIKCLKRDGYVAHTVPGAGDNCVVLVDDCQSWVLPGSVMPYAEGSVEHRYEVISEGLADAIRIGKDLLAELKEMGR